jgi:hypothetical protein
MGKRPLKFIVLEALRVKRSLLAVALLSLLSPSTYVPTRVLLMLNNVLPVALGFLEFMRDNL